MTVVLYIGKNSSDYSCYKQIFDNDSYEYEVGLDYFGYFFTINIEDAQLNRLVSHIYEIIVVCHLKEYILTKIYDEYSLMTVGDACYIIDLLVKNPENNSIIDSIKKLIVDKNRINIEQYELFNIKYIMLTINDLVDKLCRKHIFDKTRKSFIALLRTYTSLSEQFIQSADIEFTSELFCNVSVDGENPVLIENEKLISYLSDKSPQSISVRGGEYSPFLCKIISEMFNEK